MFLFCSIRNKETGEQYAIKTIRKNKVSRMDSLRREIEILQTVDHPNLIKVSQPTVQSQNDGVQHSDLLADQAGCLYSLVSRGITSPGRATRSGRGSPVAVQAHPMGW
jgi:serine/threonine protein kinase